MKNLDILKGLLLMVLALFLGCTEGLDEGLDIEPTGAVSETVYWRTESDAILAVNAIYNELDNPQSVIELDGITDIGFRSASNIPTFNDVRLGEIDPSNSTITGIWERYYRGIRKANDVLANISRVEEGDPNVMARLKAEAQFLRAYYYMQLSSLWCNAPLILEPLDVNDQRPTNSKEEIVDFVLNELENIINSEALPMSYNNDNLGRVTHGAALATKARVAIRNNKYELARDASLAVINLGVYSLYPDYEALFQSAGQNSSEIIFDRQYAVGGNVYNNFGYSAASIGGNSTVEPMMGLFEKYEYIGPVNPDDPYENKDPRWAFNVYYTGQTIGNNTYNSWPYSSTPDRVSGSEWATIYGYNLKKWVDYETFVQNPDLGDINMILIRYADVLLMYAESKIELNEIDTSVYDAINAIRQRPTVEMPAITEGKTQSELRQIVRDERVKELAFEGLRLYDLNRWELGEAKVGLLEGMLYLNENSGEWETLDYGQVAKFNPARDYCWPVPQKEMDINDVITQNPGYTN
ncbi:RagB/SusD family nutrient uptake outer membrane protein [Maribacter ulvicola]|uniref:Starch-binding associating with outer membrane n=1 Tax=Maribacter ulvicola TaxID=228959 RepID=A0A1N6RR40_9FLAO|nr:RagB/SusD family nutrient uptake outer membrane protein [Maribacter ulvicola]SIQ31176.1 Starch-binding associating with outer membrane [Maribacter ulvicola]